jgi:hypothetical protein
MIRTSIAAAVLSVVAAATPSFADGFGYDARKPYYNAPESRYDEYAGKQAVDYSGRYVVDNAHDEHCADSRKVVVEEDDYGRRYVRPAPYYGH